MTTNVARLSLPLESVAEQRTRVRPTPNQLPDFGWHAVQTRFSTYAQPG